MKFSGRLHTGPDLANADRSGSNPANWLRANLSLVGGRLELKAGDDVLGSWSTSQVKAQRLEGDRFELSLGGDRAVFAADDALGFSYEALPHLSKKPLPPANGGIRGKLLGGKRAGGAEQPVQIASIPHQDVTTTQSSPPAVETPVAPVAQPAPVGRRLRDLTMAQPARAAAETLVTPVAEPAPVAHRLRDLMEAARSAGALEPPEPAPVIDDISSSPGTLFSNQDESVQIEEMNIDESVFDDLVFGELAPSPLAGTTPTSATLEPVDVNRNLQPMLSAFEGIVDQVRNGSMTTVQVDAITRLLQAVAQLTATPESSP